MRMEAGKYRVMRRKLLFLWLIRFIAVAGLLAGCSDDNFRDDATEQWGPAGDVYIRFRMTIGNNGIPDITRVGEESGTGTGDETTPGTDRENAIETIDLLVYDAESGKLADIVSLKKETIDEITSDNGVVIPIYAHLNQSLHIYAAVNMTPTLRSRLWLDNSGEDISAASSKQDYWDVINDFVPGSDGKQENLENNVDGCIPMTGQFVTSDNMKSVIIFTEEHKNGKKNLSVTANVSRIVAKVHVLAKSEEHNVVISQKEKLDINGNPVLDENGKTVIEYVTEPVKYVIAKDYSDKNQSGTDSDENADWLGWMRLSSVRYIINGTNKSTYLFPQTQTNTDGKTVPKDLNMDLEAYRNGQLFDESLWNRDFNFYDGMSLHSANILNTQYFGKAEAYDEDKLNNTTTGAIDRYTKGLYCLENYFDTPTDESFYSNLTTAIPSVTHLSIATRLVPRRLAVLTDFPGTLDAFFKEAGDMNYSADFYRKYNITKNDLDRRDAEHWEKMKKNYFEENKASKTELYRTDFIIVKTDNEYDAESLINWSLIARGLWTGDDTDFENGRFPKNTYYVYDTKYDEISGAANGNYSQRYVYLVAGAVALAKGDNIRIKNYSVPHIGGWGYYFTYIDETQEPPADGKTMTPYTNSQVTRNKYYIITVGNFGTPGGTITEPEYIKVNTLSVGWDYAGRGDIHLH